jgi:polyhydroxyalkanoate synthesis repressor PhaR
MPVIKRYSNRKLYDIQARRYVTLGTLGRMVRDGEDVSVIDHDTGEDLTASVLAQIIFEREKKAGGLLPQDILTRLVRAGGRSIFGLQNGIRAFLDPVQHVDDDIRRRMDILVEEGSLPADEGLKFLEMLLDPRLYPIELDEDVVSMEEMDALLLQIQTLEIELAVLTGEQPSEDN